MRFGYIGLGNMGGAIAKRMILKHDIIVFDLSESLRLEFSKLGALAANSVAEVGKSADVIFLCLPTSNEVKEVILGEKGLTSSMAGGVICDMTTGDPVITREIAEELPNNITLIDGPVSGGPAGATAGTVSYTHLTLPTILLV